MARSGRPDVGRLLDEVLAMPEDGRPAYLAGLAAVDPRLREEVEALLETRNAVSGLRTVDEEAAREGSATESLQDGAARSGEPQRRTRGAPVLHAGPYELVHEIGAGGMGAVYIGIRRGEDFKRRVAVKLLRRDMLDDELQRRFRNERQILAGIDHPNIASLFDGGTSDDGRPYFAMEYIEGQKIDEYCDSQRLSIRDRLRLFQQVCGAVHFAHQNLVVHRDLKPGNILVTSEGVPKLLDFGIAKLLNPLAAAATVDRTRTGHRIMTPEYASPEQILGEPITTASDIYSLGVVLYELLTGHRPYRIKRGQPHEISRAICEDEPIRPSAAITLEEDITASSRQPSRVTPETVSRARSSSVDRLRRDLAGDLDTIVLTAMRKEPGKRYSSAQQLAEDIQRYLDGLPVMARRGSRLYRASKFVRRHWIGVAMTAAVFAGLAVFGLTMAAHQERLRAERDRAEAALRRAEAVTGFLDEAIGSANPFEGAGRDVTVVEVLDRAVHDITPSFKGLPATEAALRATIGRTYMRLGRFDEAEWLLREALAVQRDLALGSDDPDVATTMNDLANLLRRTGKYPEAEALYRESLAMRRRLLGAADPHVATVLHNLGAVRDRQSDYGGAEDYYRQALALRMDAFGGRHADVAESQNALANVLRRMGRYDEAEDLYTRSLALRRELLGQRHPLVAESLNDLAFLHYTVDDLERAEPIYLEALGLRREVLGDRHPETAQSMANLARLLRKTGRLEEAESLYLDALDVRRAVLGDRHPEIATNLNDLATLYVDTGDLARAERLYRESLDMRRELLGDEHWYVAMSLNNLAVLLNQTGRAAEAEPLFRESVAVMRKLRGADHPDVATALGNHADVLAKLGQREEAERLLLEALDIRATKFGSANRLTVRSLRDLEGFYTSQGEIEKAGEYRARAEAAAASDGGT